jgi:Ca-activated chloride channel family protein
MPSPVWLRSPRIRRGIALAAVVLSTGGLVLYKSSANAFVGDSNPIFQNIPLAAGKNSAAFSGPGAHGMVSLSHTGVQSGASSTVFAEVRLAADAAETKPVRAPISMAVVLDTSGSMSGEKIEDAKRSVLRLIGDMRDEDEIAVIRYSDTSEMIQQLARVGQVRSSLTAKIRQLDAGGGTNIPGGLSHGMRALDEAARGRVKRIVLVSDGLDSTRVQAENLARNSFGAGITVSSLGIGLDFDESYMGSIATNGHGNFAFVKDGGSLASFLHRELEETSLTTIENARVRLELPRGMSFVSATGADASLHGNEVELALGSLFAGDQRRVIVEMRADAFGGGSFEIETHASWNRVGGTTATVDAPKLTLVAMSSPADVERGKDGAVFASAVSVNASRRSVEAANAYAAGDVTRAAQLQADNDRDLAAARAVAPPAAAATIDNQMKAYGEMKKEFGAAKPSSAQGRAAAKSAVAKDQANFSRMGF